MRWPRKGILIRLFIYGPLIGYFSWQAWEKKSGHEQAVAAQSERAVDPLAGVKQSTVTLPDGSEQVIYEVTPEQAEQLLGSDAPKQGPKSGQEQVLPPQPEAPPAD